MWNLLDDKRKYKKLIEFETDEIYTYGRKKDLQNKEDIRKKAEKEIKAIKAGINQVPKNKNKSKSYAFRISIYINKTRRRKFDIDNTIKLIVDSFSQEQVSKDNSQYLDCGLYKDDSYLNPSLPVFDKIPPKTVIFCI